jgi:hypothetical protein
MRYADALAAFRQYLEAGGLAAGDLDAPSAVTAMLGFTPTNESVTSIWTLTGASGS